MIDPSFGPAPLDNFKIVRAEPSAFAGATTNARGDHDGATTGVTTLFTVTGDVLVRIWGVCTTALTGTSATVSVGVTGNTAALIATETATDIDENGIYLSETQVIGAVTLATVTGPYVIANGLDIIETVAVAPVTAGQIYYIALWRALSHDGKVVPVAAT